MKKIMSLIFSLALLTTLGANTSALVSQENMLPMDAMQKEEILNNLKSTITIRDNTENSAFLIDENNMIVTVKQLPTRLSNSGMQNYLATFMAGFELIETESGELALVAMPRANLTSSETSSDSNNQCKVTVTIGFQTGKRGDDSYMQMTSVKAVWAPTTSNISVNGMRVRGRCSGFDIFTSTGYFGDNIWSSAWNASGQLTATTNFSNAPRIEIFGGFGGTLWGDSNATIWGKDGHNWSFDFTTAYTQPGG